MVRVLPQGLAIIFHKYRAKWNNTNELKEDVGERHNEKTATAVYAMERGEGEKAP